MKAVRDYLTGLRWDGRERLSRWLEVAFGATSAVAPHAGTRWMIGAVARAMNPGCQVDHVLVLEGPAGIGKAQALEVLGGVRNFGSADCIYASGRRRPLPALAWIEELVLRQKLSAKQATDLAAWVVRRGDYIRDPWSLKTAYHPRCSAFAVTTDDAACLRGGRYWRVRCRRPLDVNALADARDQLWAEAVVRHSRGEPWWAVEPPSVEAWETLAADLPPTTYEQLIATTDDLARKGAP